ncbi:Conserved domain protein [plant metagenome]|uniref:Conserved domain protein n=1 Tax=plant metagenome TaxID=1297885 RepID=A0A484QYV1_9ZZZZ
MQLEFTSQQLAGLGEIDAEIFVLGVQQDLLSEYPGLPQAGLTARLSASLKAARGLGIAANANLVDFLKTEALVPGFYTQPGFGAWMAKPGRPPDQRFHDYMQVMQWQMRRAGPGHDKE